MKISSKVRANGDEVFYDGAGAPYVILRKRADRAVVSIKCRTGDQRHRLALAMGAVIEYPNSDRNNPATGHATLRLTGSAATRWLAIDLKALADGATRETPHARAV